MNIPKTRVQIFLDADEINLIGQFGARKGLNTVSESIRAILKEWRRFKAIALKLQEHEQQETFFDNLNKAEVIKNDTKKMD